MIIAKVVGNVIATHKQPIYSGYKLLLVRAMDLDGTLYGSDIMAIDGVGAGIGDIVVVIQEGGSARDVVRCPKKLAPIDVAIAGIIDRVDTVEGSFNQFG